jgi:putative intracellular protease/amidase
MKPTIALFIADPKCSVQSGNGIMKALGNHYNFKLFSKNELEYNFFNGVDLIAVPGGFGDADSYDTLLKHNQDRVREFVSNGGRYLGICMGAYWAADHYFNLLCGIHAVQYTKRPGTDTRRPHAKNISVTWQGTPTNMFWYDGCALIGNGSKQVVATYADGDAMAIIQDRIGLIGCHPESEQFWYDSYSWMRPHWHQGLHHQLLLDFVNKLMEQ